VAGAMQSSFCPRSDQTTHSLPHYFRLTTFRWPHNFCFVIIQRPAKRCRRPRG
jgi:hypothetical protein